MGRVRTVTRFPRPVRVVENCWIPLPDGCRLAARVWLPEDADREPVPALLEYIPYRKRDRTRFRDEPMHHYFAGHGYAAIRIDLRGSGDSDGLLPDEYSLQEHEDALHAIGWAASRPWCDGTVGMIGKSWGGFNALQVAALDPPALRAVISVCSTDDRYADDAHYMGGCLLNENLVWGSTLFTLSSLPPDPEIVGERWRSMWRQRLEANPGYIEEWLRHQRRDDYWKHGSICEAYASVRCAVFAVGGWADAYTNAVPRLLDRLDCPRMGLIGPWAHLYPHDGVPGPAIGFLQEAIRWWDQWLKGIDTGIMKEPMLRAWMQESVPPCSFHAHRPGRWVSADRWPPAGARPRLFHLAGDLLADGPAGRAGRGLPISTPQWVGGAAGAWCPFGEEGEMPPDQGQDDAASLTFDSEPLRTRLEILGAPQAFLEVSSIRPAGLLAVRLNDVRPDGSVARVTYGLLNLTHRDGHATPRPLEPGRRYRVQIGMNHIAHAFPAGHRLRLAISSTYWPLVWPSPEPGTITLHPGTGRLELPVWEDPGDLPPVGFEEPAAADSGGVVEVHPSETVRRFRREGRESVHRIETNRTETGEPALSLVPALGLRFGNAAVQEYRIADRDPLSARAEVRQTASRHGASWSIRVETTVRMRASKGSFRLETRLSAFEADQPVFERDHDVTIRRDQV